MNGPKFSALVVDAISHVDVQFDGLCLGKNLILSSSDTQLTRQTDCINVSGNRDNDADYWSHNQPGVWGDKYRIQHGQSTWYFSFMGRREDRDKFQKNWKSTQCMNLIVVYMLWCEPCAFTATKHSVSEELIVCWAFRSRMAFGC